MVPLIPEKIIAGVRAGTRPGDLLSRVHLLLLALAIVSAAAGLLVVTASNPSSPLLHAAGMAAPVVLCAAWLGIYRRGDYGVATDVAAIAAIAVFTLALDVRWNFVAATVLTAAVLFGSAYGSRPRVLLRTGVVAVFAASQISSDLASLAISIVLVAGLILAAWLMHAMVSSIDRYEKESRREQILAAAGLDLVAAGELPAIAAAALDGALALCARMQSVRVSLAVAERSEGAAPRFVVAGSAGRLAAELRDAVFESSQLAPPGQALADQRIFQVFGDETAEPAADRSVPGESEAPGPLPPPEPEARRKARFLPGEVLVTRISVSGEARGVLIVESAGPIEDEAPAAIRGLATQASLAISRADLQYDAVQRENAERLQALLQTSSDAIIIASVDGSVQFQSPSVRQIFGFEPQTMHGVHIGKLVHEEDAERVTADFRQVAAESGASRVCECRVRHADGSWRHTETRMTNLTDVPAVKGVVLNTRDVTEQHNLEAELRHQAFHDGLTGLANRVLFADRLEHSLLAARRDGSTIAVLYCDLHGMKRVNDSLGYTAGDAALVMIADRLRSNIRGRDTVARMGGNEFTILLDRLSSPYDATVAVERIMALLRRPFQLPAAQVEFQPNIGLAVSIRGTETADELLHNGAVAMHQARRGEGGYAAFDPEMHADAIRRIEVESELRTAIDHSQLLLHYQPTIELQTGRFTGVEALVRWQHPRRGIVPPMEFIPLAEESGLIVPLGQWALQEACRQVRIWQTEIPADEPIALNVNLSARQLRHPDLVGDIADALDDTGLLPSRLILEITESVLMVDTAATLSRLAQLKSLGVRLAVDDFGTGYSSFAYLRRFPVDILKIDKSFIDGVATEATAGALVDAMIRIGKTLNLETVAEGVERIEQADRLRALQCDIGQGFLFSRPLPSHEITALLHERAGRSEADAA